MLHRHSTNLGKVRALPGSVHLKVAQCGGTWVGCTIWFNAFNKWVREALHALFSESTLKGVLYGLALKRVHYGGYPHLEGAQSPYASLIRYFNLCKFIKRLWCTKNVLIPSKCSQNTSKVFSSGINNKIKHSVNYKCLKHVKISFLDSRKCRVWGLIRKLVIFL